jgi:hypothetical protein
MAETADSSEIIPQNTTSRIDALSPEARHVLEGIVNNWLNETECGRTMLRVLSIETANIAVLRLIDGGAVTLVTGTPTPESPFGMFGLKLTDYGYAVIGRGLVQ